MHEKLKNTLRSVDILYVAEENLEEDYHIMPFRIICDHISLSGFRNAWNKFISVKPSIVLIHVMNDSHDAGEFIKKIRKLNYKPTVILFTSKELEKDLGSMLTGKIQKLLTHPLTFEELIMALEQSIDYNNLFYHINDEIIFEPNRSSLVIKGESVSLTQKESKLLTLLIKNRHRIVNYYEIDDFVWTQSSMSRNSLTSIIRNIRKKANFDNIIKNHSNQGYQIGR